MHDPYAHITLPAGTILFEEGEPGAYAYLITSGRIEIFLRRDGREIPLAVRGAGEIFGEMAILDSDPRSASARALEDCLLVPVSEAQIRHRLSETDPILRLCLGVVMARYRETASLLKEKGVVARRDAPPAGPSPSAQADFDAAISAVVLERELRRALDRREFELFFQPIVRLGGEQLAGFEALIRWRHPERGLVPPAAFIPVAEESGLIVDVTDWVVAEVGRVMPEIMLAGLQNVAAVDGSLFVSVNVSGHDLARASFPGMICEMLRTTGIAPGSLKLEITESTLMRDPGSAADALTLCRASGMGIAIDDFGTGYSSLSYLSTLPITTLKVDRAFVRAMLSEPRDRKIVQTILRLADEIGIPVVAEGIEEREEAVALAAMGCAYGQGYLFGRPVPLPETLALIRSWNGMEPVAHRLPAA
ncbi:MULTISPECIES: EAL domain-containing protein [Methylobacterium]|uniref:EAL domain-containing protein n=1 Tax=Methylobacterium TaxID=407 RepID=UPI0010460454|nr:MULTISPECIES: EAL domain-containing protein [Methylobacterium]MDR7035283.1 EAL domain-containing protein (putative c-di-GMP-specific phosphodiesterase class I) [Methylobacterium sp. BE186]